MAKAENMETRITATQLAKSLSDILNRVRYRGERFVIERGGEPVATLGPPDFVPGLTLWQIAERLKGVQMPGDGFADDLERIHASQGQLGPPPWPSS